MKSRSLFLLVLAALLLLPAAGWAHFGLLRWPRTTVTYYYYYYAEPVICVPSPPPPVYTAVPAPTAAPLYAAPEPAPPSGTAEPPLAPRVGTPTEARRAGRTAFDAYYVGRAGTARPAADRCTVTFWNQTSQPLLLTADGREYWLSAGQNLRLELKRDFAWGVSGREPHRQQVPAEEVGVDIVIRG